MVALLKMPPQISEADGRERRVFPRKEIHAQIDSRRMDHTVSAHRFPRFTLALRDLSIGGLSAISPTPLDRGERLSVNFPEHGALRPWSALGRVIRCEQSSLGYRVAVEFDAMPLAA